MSRRPICEPGGALLIGWGAPPQDLAAAIARLYGRYRSLSVIIAPHQYSEARAADEVWVAHRLGMGGFLALLRRIAWRRFDAVYQPVWARPYILRWLVVPRPQWYDDISS